MVNSVWVFVGNARMSGHTLILGYGKTGQSVHNFLNKQQKKVTIIGNIENISIEDVPYDIEHAVVSPGISKHHRLIRQLETAGISCIADLDLFAQHVTCPVIGITGTNGKTTVCHLLKSALESCGLSVMMGGNQEIPALDLLKSPSPDFIILELSSFQLTYTNHLSCCVGAIVNIAADHQDWHKSLDEYKKAKLKLVDFSEQCYLSDLCELKVMNTKQLTSLLTIKDQQYYWRDMLLKCPYKGEVFAKNIGVVLSICEALSLQVADIVNNDSLILSPLSHRFEMLAETNGIQWINDSKATNSAATRAALTNLIDRPQIYLILGGVAKEDSFETLSKDIDYQRTSVVAYGQAGNLIKKSIHLDHQCQTLQGAVDWIKSRLRHGDCVLLSPSCASFDQFANYQERGEWFKNYVTDS